LINYTDEIKSLNLWEKIANISAEVEYLQKDDTVGFGSSKYKAISIEKVITAVADKMVKYGIVIYPIEQLYKRENEEVIKKDGSIGINRISDVDVKYKVVNIHNPGEVLEVVSSGCGVDTQDKGIGKAMTYAYKNMIIKLFNIATGDDTDKVHSDDYTKKLLGEGKGDDKVKALYALGNRVGITPIQVMQVIKKDYNKGRIEDLTDIEYKAVEDRLKAKAENK
jgi:hypothetical protein